MRESVLGRFTAFLIAAAALCGDGLLLRDTVSREHAGWLHGTWTDLMFFSDISNFLVAMCFLLVSLGLIRARRPWWLGLTLVCISLVCVGAQGWRGVARPVTGNTLVHTWVPLAVALWYVTFARKGSLRWINLLTWSFFPITYLAYVLARGASTEIYPYPWLDSSKVGGHSVAINVALQIATFLVLAFLVIAVDRFWPKQPREVV